MNKNVIRTKKNHTTILISVVFMVLMGNLQNCTTKPIKTYPSGNPSEVLDPNIYNVVQEKETALSSMRTK